MCTLKLKSGAESDVIEAAANIIPWEICLKVYKYLLIIVSNNTINTYQVGLKVYFWTNSKDLKIYMYKVQSRLFVGQHSKVKFRHVGTMNKQILHFLFTTSIGRVKECLYLNFVNFRIKSKIQHMQHIMLILLK